MIFLGNLLLFTNLLIVSANQALILDADCDDSNITQAADMALKSYNAAKRHGNQYILHRITKAGTRSESNSVVHNFVDYEIREGACGVQSGLDWKECNFLTPKPVLGKCSAHVVINEELKSSDIIFQNCTVPPVHATVIKETLGSFKPIDLSSNDLLEIVQLNIDRMNSLGNHRFHFGLEKIQNAWLQMVSGMNYRIEYVVRKTNCSKIEFRNMRSEKCILDENGETGRCSTNVHSDLQGHMNVTNLNCYTESGYCLSCPNVIKQNDPELLSLLVQFIDEFNANNSHPFLYKLFFVKQATKKGLHPTTYRVHIQMKETNCSKNEYAILGEECGFTNTSGLLDCDVKMYVKDETVAQSHKCRTAFAFLLRYQGYSPLRASRSRRDHGSHLKNEKHGKKETHSKKEKEKKKAGSNKDKTSQESSEDRENTTPVPESSVAQRCPGKVWQQNLKQAHAPFELVAAPPIYYHKQERRSRRGNMPHFV